MSQSDLSEEKESPERGSEGQEPQAPQEGEPVPTDYRRNIWLLVIIIAVVVVAWVLAILWKRRPVPELEALQGPVAAQPRTAPVAPSAPPRVMRLGPVPVSLVIGTNSEVIEASPPRLLPEMGITYRRARFFDVTQRLPELDLNMLLRLPTWSANQAPVLRVSDLPESPFQPAAQVTALAPEERVVVASGGSQVKAYPVRALMTLAGVQDVLGEEPIFVCWSHLTQAGRCFVARVEGQDVDWQDAGLVFHGNNVYYDAGTGSLWDSLSGAALTGALSGRKADIKPLVVWRWEDWRADNPAGEVFAAGIEGRAAMAAAADVDPYLSEPALPFEAEQFDSAVSPLPAKAFVLGVAVGDQARAYPLAQLAAEGTGAVTDTLGGQEYAVHVTSPRTAYAMSGGEPVDAVVMLWFAWLEAHPNSDVYRASPQAPGAPAESQ